MGGKKKGKGGKKKKGGGEFDLDLNESNQVLEAMQQSLVAKLITETDHADRCKASENEKRLREMQLERKVKAEAKIQMEIIADMTRQYKSVEEELMNRINRLEQRKDDNAAEIVKLGEIKKNLEAEINDITTAKKDEINKLKKSIEDMSHEFATMLKDTLEKMKTKIESAN